MQQLHPLYLPASVLAEILTDWLNVKSLLQLDSAACCKDSRKAFLEVVYSKEFCVHELPNSRGMQTLSMEWFVSRNAKLMRAHFLTPELDIGNFTAFLHAVGGALKDVHLKQCPLLSATLLNLLSFSSPRLKCLTIDDCDPLSSRSLGTLLSVCAQSLQYLKLVSCSISVPLMASRLPDLRVLHISKCSVDIDTVCKLIASSTALRSFHCDDMFSRDECFEALAAHCPLLQVLSYEKGNPDSAVSLARMLQACPLIEVIDISAAVHVHDRSIAPQHVTAIMQHCKKLKAFFAPYMPDASVLEVAARAYDLQHLCLYDIDTSEDELILALAQTCGNLSSLELWSSSEDSSQEALVALASNLKSIVHLRIDGCELGDAVMQALAANCPLLESVHLRCCDGYTEEGIAALAQGCTALRTVYLHEDDAVVTPIARLLWKVARPAVEFKFCDWPIWSVMQDYGRLHIGGY